MSERVAERGAQVSPVVVQVAMIGVGAWLLWQLLGSIKKTADDLARRATAPLAQAYVAATTKPMLLAANSMIYFPADGYVEKRGLQAGRVLSNDQGVIVWEYGGTRYRVTRYDALGQAHPKGYAFAVRV